MKCPYAVNRRTVSQTNFEYDEEGAQTLQQTVENNTASFLDCLEKDCGAWKNGQCEYHGSE